MESLQLLKPVALAGIAPLCVLVALCWWLAKRSQKHLVAVAQLLMGLAMLIALAYPVQLLLERVAGPDASLAIISDVSPSYAAKGLSHPAFPEGSQPIYVANTANLDSADSVQTEPASTDLAAGLALALAQPRSGVVLRTDGRELRGNALAIASGMDQRVLIADPGKLVDLRVVTVRTIPARPDRDARIEVLLESNAKVDASLHLHMDDQLAELNLSVEPGLQTVTHEFAANGRSRVAITAEVRHPEDKNNANNAYRAVWRALDPPLLAIVAQANHDTTSVARFFESRGWVVQRWKPNAVSASSLERLSAVLMFGQSAKTFTDEQHAAMDGFVKSGGGLALVGGSAVYGVSALDGSAWESWLPVQPAKEAKPIATRASFALVLIIDVSGSMQTDNRLGMAKQAATQTIQLLDPADQVGVLTFSTKTTWVSDVAPSGDKKELLKRIDALEVEADTNLAPALEKAELALAEVHADRKNLIVLTDGISSPGDFDAISERLRDGKVSVATVSVSAGAEQLMLKDIARISHGRHEHCDDASQLPQVLVRETQQAVESLQPTTHTAFELEGGLDGIDLGAAPPLTGAVVTTPRSDTVLAYLTNDGQPLLVWRKHGEGQVASLVCSADELLGERWRAWSGYTTFWNAIVRKLERSEPENYVSIRGEAADGVWRPVVDVRRPDGGWNSAARVTVETSTGEERSLPLVAPGRYSTEIPGNLAFDTAGRINAMFRIRQQSDEVRRSWEGHQNYGEELRHVGENRALLQSIAAASQGRFIKGFDEVGVEDSEIRNNEEQAERVVQRAVWNWFAAGAVLLLLVETCFRRWSIRFGADR